MEEIVVTAHKALSPQELERVVPRFVQSHGSSTAKTGQFARWRAAICVATTGLPASFNALVSARVTAEAAHLGVAVNRLERCPPNVEVIFTTEPQKILDYAGRKAPVLLGFHSPSDARRLTTFDHIVQAWYVTATRNAEGVQVADREFHHTPGGSASSRFGGGVSAVLVHVLVIGDANKVAGYSVGSIGDYVSMLALSYAPSLDDCNDLPSILNLMAAGCGPGSRPEAMTAGDEAYLNALYHTDLDYSGFLERSHIQAQMQQQLLRAQ